MVDNLNDLKIDFITWTGDNAAHDLWDFTQLETVQSTTTITDVI